MASITTRALLVLLVLTPSAGCEPERARSAPPVAPPNTGDGGHDAAVEVPLAVDAAGSPDAAPVDLASDVPESTDVAPADAGCDVAPDAGEPPLQLWLYLRRNLQVDEQVEAGLALIERAAAAGYTGIVLGDFKFSLVHTGGLIDRYPDNVARVAEQIRDLGLDLAVTLFPFGYSEGILRSDPNLAEGQPVVGARFVVAADGGSLEHAPEGLGWSNGGFEEHEGHQLAGWDYQDEPGVRTVIDTEVFHGGAAALRIDPGEGNARVYQRFDVPQARQVHVRFWVRTEEVSSDWRAAMLLDAEGRRRSFFELEIEPTRDWTRFDFVANSAGATRLSLYLGLWGSSRGRAWFDDVLVQEVALVNLIRRPGAPLSVYRESGEELVEEQDVARIVDPVSGHAGSPGAFDDWHQPPVVVVPDTSQLSPGDVVLLDYYAVAPVHGWQVGACLSEPAVDDWMRDNIAALAPLFPDGTGFFLQHDEMRHMNTCGLCAGRGLPAGALLADQVARATGIVRDARPGVTLYVWSDMFDPHHNAHDDYYLVEGDLAGSWEGLPADLTLMNWNGGDRAASLAFFSGRGHRQLIAGYYDSGDGAASGRAEVLAGRDVPGFLGLMYTTWRHDYGQLEAYAAAALAAAAE